MGALILVLCTHKRRPDYIVTITQFSVREQIDHDYIQRRTIISNVNILRIDATSM